MQGGICPNSQDRTEEQTTHRDFNVWITDEKDQESKRGRERSEECQEKEHKVGEDVWRE